jgi:hypothetical protein
MDMRVPESTVGRREWQEGPPHIFVVGGWELAVARAVGIGVSESGGELGEEGVERVGGLW